MEKFYFFIIDGCIYGGYAYCNLLNIFKTLNHLSFYNTVKCKFF